MSKIKLFKNFNKNTQVENVKSNVLYKLLISIFTISLCSYFFTLRIANVENTQHKPALGLTWYDDDIIAEYSFPILRDKGDYLTEKNKVEKDSRIIFTLNPFEQQNALTKTDRYFQGLMNDSTINQNELSKVYSDFRSIVNTIYQSGFINYELDEIEQDEIFIENESGLRNIIKKRSVFDITKARDLVNKSLISSKSIALEQLNLEILLLNKFKANYEYSEPLTNKNRSLRIKSIPRTNGYIKKGDVIISKNTIVTEENLRILDSFYANKNLFRSDDDKILVYIGTIGHLLIILAFLYIYIFKIKEEEYFDNLKFSLISFFIIFVTISSWITLNYEFEYPLEFLIFLPAISILSTIIFDVRTAFYLTITLALLAAGLRGNDYSTGVMMMFSGFMAIFSVRDIQSRGQLFKSILFVFIGFLLPIIFFGLESNIDYSELLTKLAFASINSALSPLLAFGMLFLIEQFTYINTNLGLQEYDNLNHPLLQQLNEKTPGTYQHSLGVSALAERCAGSIGANTLFCKVAPYYHDIGKMEQPEYFAENQINIENKHNMISPFQSAEIIKNHVIVGEKLAKKYKLPKNIIDVINTHHGTTLIKHFYAKAIELNPEKIIDKNDFTYSGPKPNSKETAIIMICDQAEAISRIENKTQEEFEKMINNIINSMIEQNQFDYCDLTTSELNTISEVLKKTLSGITHKRVDYKEIKEK
ncbi:HDIG domain-containing protein [Candidatus Kapabacteria bacterium]|nr:HDIG domain-containing protein [Candidatus Kapabacteria bacterium]